MTEDWKEVIEDAHSEGLISAEEKETVMKVYKDAVSHGWPIPECKDLSENARYRFVIGMCAGKSYS